MSYTNRKAAVRGVVLLILAVALFVAVTGAGGGEIHRHVSSWVPDPTAYEPVPPVACGDVLVLPGDEDCLDIDRPRGERGRESISGTRAAGDGRPLPIRLIVQAPGRRGQCVPGEGIVFS